MKQFKIICLLFLLINFSSCISFEKSEKKPDLSEAMKLNSNEKILSKLDINEDIEFGYSTVSMKFLTKKSQRNTINVKITTEDRDHSIPENFLLKKSERIQKVLKEEMATYENFDQIDFRLMLEGKEIQKMTIEI